MQIMKQADWDGHDTDKELESIRQVDNQAVDAAVSQPVASDSLPAPVPAEAISVAHPEEATAQQKS